MQPTTVDALVARYDVFFLDAYGVLVCSDGPLPGAAEFLTRLKRAGKTTLILSNDASRAPDTSLRRYQGFGLPLTAGQILTSGMLLRDHFVAQGLVGARTIVLGTEDSERYVREAGGEVTRADDDSAQVLVVGDDDGYPFLDTVNDAITVLLRRMDRGERTDLLLPNPDLVFPRRAGAYGVTSGAIAAMIESVLWLRDPARQLRFQRLGKPHAPMFQAALRKVSAGGEAVDRRRVVMVGDQIVTDIKGAADAGLDSVFVESGIGRRQDCAVHGVNPTWVLPSVQDEMNQ